MPRGKNTSGVKTFVNPGTNTVPTDPTQWSYANLENAPPHPIGLPELRGTGTSGGGTSGGGGNPFLDDPGYQQLTANLGAAGALDASERQRLIQQSLIKFGLVPEGMKDPYGDVTDLVRKLAGEKTGAGLSTYARLQDWNKTMLSRLKRALAARGALRSGELGFGLGRQDLGYRQSFDDAVSQLLDYISGAQYAFANSELNRANQQAAGLFNSGASASGYVPPTASSPAASPVSSQLDPLRGGLSGPLQTLLGGPGGVLRGTSPSYRGTF